MDESGCNQFDITEIEGYSKLFDEDKHAQLESLLRNLLPKRDNADIRYWLADSLWAQLKFDEAKVEYKRARELDPDNPTYDVNIKILDTMELPVHQRLEVVMQLGDYPVVYLVVGDLLRELDRYEEAIQWYKRITDCMCLFGALFGIAYSYQQLKNWDKATEYAERISDLHPNSVQAKRLKFDILIGRGLLNEAKIMISDMEKEIEVNPIVHVFRGFLDAESGDFVSAANQYTMAIEEYPWWGELYSSRARVYYQLKRYDQSSEDIEIALEIASDKVTPLRLRVCVERGKRQYWKALQTNWQVFRLILDRTLSANRTLEAAAKPRQ